MLHACFSAANLLVNLTGQRHTQAICTEFWRTIPSTKASVLDTVDKVTARMQVLDVRPCFARTEYRNDSRTRPTEGSV